MTITLLLDSAGSALKPSPQTLHNKLCHHQLDLPAVSEPISIFLLSLLFFVLLLFFFFFSAVALLSPHFCPSCPPWTGGRENVFHLHVLVRPRIMIDDRGFVCRGKREGDRAWPNVVAGSGIRTARRVARDSARTCLRSPSCLPRASAPFLRSSAHRVAYASRE